MRWPALLVLFAMSAGCDGTLHFTEGGTDASAAGIACSTDSDCPAPTAYCDEAARTCVACTSDGQCTAPGLSRCDVALHRCVACGSDVDCGGGLVCAPSLQQCVTPCAEGATEHDCPASAPTCNEKARYCVSCTSDEECTAITDDGNFCNPSTGQCVECMKDSDCTDLEPRCDLASLECVECLTSSDCLDEDACDPAKMTCD